MAKSVEAAERIRVTPRMLAAMRQGEADRQWLAEHPAVLEPFRGEWVVVHKGRIVAHSSDAAKAALAAPAEQYNGVLLDYVPTREEAQSVHMYSPIFAVRPPASALDHRQAPGDEPSSHSR